MRKPIKVPISTARALAERFGYDQVIVYAFNRDAARQCVTTFGRNAELCEEAARAGDLVGMIFRSEGRSVDFLRQIQQKLAAHIERLEKAKS